MELRSGNSIQINATSLGLARNPLYSRATAEDRRELWEYLKPKALAAKDRELSQGLDANGKKFLAICPRPRSVRRRAQGRGDGPPLMPSRKNSRTRRLLRASSSVRGIRLYWAGNWARILGYHADPGIKRRCRAPSPAVRDVFGLTDAALKRLYNEAETWLKRKERAKKKADAIKPVSGRTGIERMWKIVDQRMKSRR